MKKLTVLTLACPFAVLLFAGCKKNNNSYPNVNGISATLGGISWQSQYTVGTAPANKNFIYLYGYSVNSGDTSVIELDISDSVHLNEPDPFHSSTAFFSKSDGTTYILDDFFGGHGTLTVTARFRNIHKIAGTFSGVFYNTQNSDDSIQIEKGHFNTSYFPE
jgi:hypothetical protein